ncbi:unnamed protein product, partial [Prorocentrum cordatum]
DFYHQLAFSDARESTDACGLARELRAHADFPSDPARALEERGGAAVRGGCLADSETICGMELAPAGPAAQGLCVGDHFVVERVHVQSARSEAGADAALLAAARQAYAREGLPGSTAKAVAQELLATLVGAEMDGRQGLAQRGLVTAGAPLERRLALSALSLTAARLKAASRRLLATLAPSWMAVFADRRPLMAVLDHMFKVLGVAEAGFKTRKAEAAAKLGAVYGLPKPVKDELALAPVLAPMAVTDISAPYDDRINAVDASQSKGTAVSTPAPAGMVARLWRCGERRGGCPRLESAPKVASREIGQLRASAEPAHFDVLDEPG